eukprot:45867-Prymnesium_polylepis.1
MGSVTEGIDALAIIVNVILLFVNQPNETHRAPPPDANQRMPQAAGAATHTRGRGRKYGGDPWGSRRISQHRQSAAGSART